MSMAAMTMAYGVVDKKMLSNVKVGDKVKFRLETVNNAPNVVRLEPSR
jgi:Cu/Ag efflux protein CusF